MDQPEETYRTPWVGIIAGVLVAGGLPFGVRSLLVAAAVSWAAQYVYNFIEDWREVNSSTGSLPKSSSILFWRRPRPRQE